MTTAWIILVCESNRSTVKLDLNFDSNAQHQLHFAILVTHRHTLAILTKAGRSPTSMIGALDFNGQRVIYLEALSLLRPPSA
eukprot:COSAG02_NODE_4301_length_5532_cov_4.804120_3_plen_82_part_00